MSRQPGQGAGSGAPCPPEAAFEEPTPGGVCEAHLYSLRDRLAFVETVRLEGLSDQELAMLAQRCRRTARAVETYRQGRKNQ